MNPNSSQYGKSQAFCSPSKIEDLRRYFVLYPKYPLATDLFIDILIYQTLILSEEPFSSLFHASDIKNKQWKRAFEDLANRGVFKLDPGYRASKDELKRFMGRLLSGGFPDERDDVMDLAFVTLAALRENTPTSYREEDIHWWWNHASTVVRAIQDAKKPVQFIEPASADIKRRVANWFVKFSMPSLSAHRVQNFTAPWTRRLMKANYIAPDELVSLLSDTRALDQLREQIETLAATNPSELEVGAHIASARRALEKNIRIGDFIFEAIDLCLVPVPPPFSVVLGAASKVGRKLSIWSINQPYRWLLHTEKFDSHVTTL